MRDNITRNNMDASMAAKWFPFIATLFLFIWISNLIGYIPLPTNTEHPIHLFGLDDPLLRDLRGDGEPVGPARPGARRLHRLHRRGRPREGPDRLPQGARSRRASPAGSPVFIFVLELFSNFLRLISLSVRLFANILAGHLIILFMAGGIAVLLGIAAIGWLTLPLGVILFIFEVGLVATLQAFIFATLASIYFGGAVAHRPLIKLEHRSNSSWTSLNLIARPRGGPKHTARSAGGKIALGVGGGLGAAGAGIGIGYIFGNVIQAVTRQPEMRDEITSIQWLGFALTEACVFYGLVARPARLLPLGRRCSQRSSSLAAEAAGGGGRQLPRLARHRADGVDAARLRDLRLLLKKYAFPQIARRSTSASASSRSRSTRPPRRAPRPRSCSRSTASASPRPASRPRRSSPAPARRPRRARTRRSRRPRAKREELLAQTKRDIEAETRRAIQDIRNEVADLTILATEKITRKTLTEDDQRSLVEEALARARLLGARGRAGARH